MRASDDRTLRVSLDAANARHLQSLCRAVGALDTRIETGEARAVLTARFAAAAPRFLEDRVESWLSALGAAHATLVTAKGDGPWLPGWSAVYTGAIVDRFHIRPPWRTPESGGIDVVIDPRGAFGSGLHPTTDVMLRALETALAGSTGRRLVDVGAGTGILSIAAARLGLTTTAVEIDPAGREACRRNAESSGVDIRMVDVPVEALDERFDVVLANLNTPALKELRDALLALLEPTARTLVLGGFHPGQRAELETIYGLGSGRCLVSDDGEWAALILGG